MSLFLFCLVGLISFVLLVVVGKVPGRQIFSSKPKFNGFGVNNNIIMQSHKYTQFSKKKKVRSTKLSKDMQLIAGEGRWCSD